MYIIASLTLTTGGFLLRDLVEAKKTWILSKIISPVLFTHEDRLVIRAHHAIPAMAVVHVPGNLPYFHVNLHTNDIW